MHVAYKYELVQSQYRTCITSVSLLITLAASIVPQLYATFINFGNNVHVMIYHNHHKATISIMWRDTRAILAQYCQVTDKIVAPDTGTIRHWRDTDYWCKLILYFLN